MKLVFNFFVIYFVLIFNLIGQKELRYDQLDIQFKDYQILELDARSVHQQLKSNRGAGSFSLKISENATWHLFLENSNIIADNYIVSVATENGIETQKGTEALPMKGHVIGRENSRVSLTFNNDFIYGFIQMGQQTFFIEPLYHFVGNTEGKFVLYNVNDIIENNEGQCGYELYKEKLSQHRVAPTKKQGVRMTGECLRIEIAIASDYSMFQQYGNTGTQNHNIGVLNNVQTNYDDEFADELLLVLMEQWLSTCSTCDPWPNSTNSSVVLDSFTSWAVGGFSNSHNLGSMWSRRVYQNNVIGLAWVGVLCTSYKYNILQDFSSNAQLKRCLMAHEMGHNFDASHNTGIMAPSVSTSNTWSATSKAEIEGHYNSVSCITNCPSSNPPTPNFTFNILTNCSPAEVQFFDSSTNATSWSWTFEGGVPLTSTLQNPLVTFAEGGIHNITLVATNSSGSASITIPVNIPVTPIPTADFVYTISDHVVSFVYSGIGGTSFLWSFGDGTPNSSVQNPVHTYALNGVYTASLDVSNACGMNAYTVDLEISVIPFVNFVADFTQGCEPLNVTFTNLSTNALSYFWIMPGATPTTSTAVNPSVVYNSPGIYNVTLMAANSAGEAELEISQYINVAPQPNAGFSSTVSGNTANFISVDTLSEIYWDFGDLGTSNLRNPVHQYQDNGVYTVEQTVINDCGTAVSSGSVTIAIPPIPSFTSSNSGAICQGSTVEFTSTTTFSPTNYQWTFEGGTPSTSNLSNPIIAYNTPGTFSVTLTASNGNGSSTIVEQGYISVNPLPVVSYTYLGDGLDVTFNQQILHGTSFNWSFGDGNTSTAPNPTHTYASEGTYNVVLSATNSCGTVNYAQSVLVQLLPTPSFSVSNQTVCAGQEVQFTNQSSPSTNMWSWLFEGGIPDVANISDPIIQYPTPGTFDVTLTVGNSSGQNTITLTDYINVLTTPTADFTVNVQDNQIVLQNTGQYAQNSQWTISGNGQVVQLTGENITWVAPSNGQFSIVLENSNLCGTTSSAEVVVEVTAYPSANFNINGGNGACVNLQNVFYTTGNNLSTYSWIFENGIPGTSNAPNPSVTYTQTGNFNVYVIVTNSFGSDTVSTYVAVGDLPESKYNFTIDQYTFTGTHTGTGAETFRWEMGDGTVIIDTNVVHNYVANGVYNVLHIVGNGCGLDTFVKEVLIDVSSTYEETKQLRFEVIPNPVREKLIVKYYTTSIGKWDIEVLDVLGQQCIQLPVYLDQSGEVSIDVNHLPSGIYFITLRHENERVTRRVLITH